MGCLLGLKFGCFDGLQDGVDVGLVGIDEGCLDGLEYGCLLGSLDG